MIDARAAVIQLRALLSSADAIDESAVRRLVLRATSAIADEDLAHRLNEALNAHVEFLVLALALGPDGSDIAGARADALAALDLVVEFSPIT